MPNYKKHLVGGSIVYAALTITTNKLNLMPPEVSLQLQTLAACLIGSLFPDIDTKSKIQKYTYSAILITSLCLFISGFEYQAGILATASMLPLIVSHRGLFHRMWFIILIVSLGNFLCYLNEPKWFNNCFWSSIFFLSGAISHIWLDMGWKKLFDK
jgi:membrane-bound metal-dependent hydrolase YbcI (DUF457 family)